ncbi:MAG: purine-nucleoside phosphorylase [Acidobacteriota bacterium]
MDVPAAARRVRDLLGRRDGGDVARAGIILGSGLGPVTQHVHDLVEISQAEIPGFPAAGVPGHRGVLAFGTLGGAPVALCVGRAHLYEGRAPHEVAFAVHLMKELGAGTLCVTTAAGGIHPELRCGELVLISDQINLTGGSPLLEASAPIEDRFVDMTDAYDPALRALARAHAPRREGVVAAVRGPQYETPAEIRMLRAMGADLVCMSVACEVIAARSLGMRVLGVAVVANPAAGVTGEPITHRDVLANVTESAGRLGLVLAAVIGPA